MMSSAEFAPALWWKELRQLWPLVLMLSVIGLLLVLFGLLIQDPTGFTTGLADIVPWALPMLFAVGAGAILIGDEKERQTLGWLSSLPISPGRIVIAKVGAALVGLAVMWCVSWLLIGMVGETAVRSIRVPLEPLAYQVFRLVIHSVFLLGCGMFAAWWFRNTFLSLFAIVPLATLPALAAQGFWAIRYAVTGRYRVSSAWMDSISLGGLVIGMIAIYVLIFRVGIKTLHPAPPPDLGRTASHRLRNVWSPPGSASSPTIPFRHTVSSIVWQMARHSRWILLGIGLAMFVAAWAFPNLASLDVGDRDPGWIVLPIGFGIAATAWLGVLVFAGDGSSRRLRFLADRGVSPAKVWLARQLVGLSIIATAVLIYAFAQATTNGSQSFPMPSVAMYGLVLWAIYSVSQWVSQLLSMLGMSTVLAPVLALMGLYWLGFSALQLRTPLWLLVLVTTLPWLGTLLLMRRFMDGNRPPAYWCLAGAVVALFAVIPVTPFMARVATAPDMPGEMRSRLLSEAAEIPRQVTLQLMRNELSIHDNFTNSKLSGEAALAIYQSTDLSPQARFTGLVNGRISPQAVSIDPAMVLNAATLELLKFEREPDDAQARESLGEWMTFVVDAVSGMRASHDWKNQESADALEIWLLRTLSRDGMKSLKTESWYQQAVKVLADPANRSRARRTAVLASWRRYNEQQASSKPGSRVGGYPLDADTGSVTKQYWTNRKTADAVVDAAIRLIDAGSKGQPTKSIRRQLHNLIVGPRIQFEDGPYSDRIRTGRLNDFVFSLDQTMRYPANQWYAGWEQDAVELAQALEQASEDSVDGQEAAE